MAADDTDDLRRRVEAFITANSQSKFLAAADGLDRKTLKAFLRAEHDTQPAKVAQIADAMDLLDAEAARPHDPASYVAGLIKHARPDTQQRIVDMVEFLLSREKS